MFSFINSSGFVAIHPLSLSLSIRSIHFAMASVAVFGMFLKHVFDTFYPRSFSTRNSLKGILLVANPARAPSHTSQWRDPRLKYGADQRNVSDVDLFRVNQLPTTSHAFIFSLALVQMSCLNDIPATQKKSLFK